MLQKHDDSKVEILRFSYILFRCF